MKNKAIKFRLYPTKEQEEYLLKLFGSCRYIYNNTLAYSIEQYEAGIKTNYYDWAKRLTELKAAEETKWLKEVDAQSLQQSLMNLKDAFQNFFSLGRGYPKFKSRHNHKDSAKILKPKLVDGRLYIPKLKTGIKTDWHREPEEGWELCSCTLSHVPSGKYFVSCLFKFEEPYIEYKQPEKFLGLDYAQHGLYVDSNGDSPDIRRAFVESQDKLAKAQRKLSRTKKGSNNHEKQRVKVAKIHEHISNIRLNQLHQLSYKLAEEYDCIVVEDINVKEMGEHLNLGKNERDNGWGMFTTFLKYKLEDRGKFFFKVDKYYPSSQICNCCGHQWPGTKDLSVRSWTCPNCGDTHDRDTNAARNLRDSGIEYFASLERREEPVDTRCSASLSGKPEALAEG